MRNPRRAFSLTELLVVISILIILLAIAVPALRNLTENSERSLAENQLRVALGAARDAAIRSESGDGAAYFRFEPGGRITVVPCVSVGRFDDAEYEGLSATNSKVSREIFAPLSSVEPVALPRGWSVRAFTPPGTLSNGGTNRSGWYENFSANAADGNWVFPETNFVGVTGGAQVRLRGVFRHSFIVRFQQGTGLLDVSDRSTAVVLDPVPADEFRNTAPLSEQRVLQASDLGAFARRAMNRRYAAPGELNVLLGDLSIDSVLVRPVTELALYRESTMLGSVGARANAVTGTIYAAPATGNVGASYDQAVLPQGVNQQSMQVRINNWVMGTLSTGNTTVPSDARVFMLQRYMGQMQEITP